MFIEEGTTLLIPYGQLQNDSITVGGAVTMTFTPHRSAGVGISAISIAGR
jgi:hypothetical protein